MKYFVRFSVKYADIKVTKENVQSSIILDMSLQDLDHGIPRVAQLVREKIDVSGSIDIVQLNPL